MRTHDLCAWSIIPHVRVSDQQDGDVIQLGICSEDGDVIQLFYQPQRAAQSLNDGIKFRGSTQAVPRKN